MFTSNEENMSLVPSLKNKGAGSQPQGLVLFWVGSNAKKLKLDIQL